MGLLDAVGAAAHVGSLWLSSLRTVAALACSAYGLSAVLIWRVLLMINKGVCSPCTCALTVHTIALAWYLMPSNR